MNTERNADYPWKSLHFICSSLHRFLKEQINAICCSLNSLHLLPSSSAGSCSRWTCWQSRDLHGTVATRKRLLLCDKLFPRSRLLNTNISIRITLKQAALLQKVQFCNWRGEVKVFDLRRREFVVWKGVNLFGTNALEAQQDLLGFAPLPPSRKNNTTPPVSSKTLPQPPSVWIEFSPEQFWYISTVLLKPQVRPCITHGQPQCQDGSWAWLFRKLCRNPYPQGTCSLIGNLLGDKSLVCSWNWHSDTQLITLIGPDNWGLNFVTVNDVLILHSPDSRRSLLTFKIMCGLQVWAKTTLGVVRRTAWILPQHEAVKQMQIDISVLGGGVVANKETRLH